MVLRLRGGGGGFNSFAATDMESSKRIEWAAEAPAWRRAAFGLNLEGSCGNSGCKAFDQAIILPIGMCEKFDLTVERLEQRCPVVSFASIIHVFSASSFSETSVAYQLRV